MLHISLGITLYICFVAGLLGACMGSFLNCCAWRIVHGEPIAKGRSHCDSCGHVLSHWDLVPIFSYLLSGGKCRYCGGRLSRRHLLAELCGAAAFISILLKYDLSLQALQMLVLVCVLLAASLTDLEGMIIPDRFVIIGLLSGLSFPLLGPQPLAGLGEALLGLLVPAALLILVLLAEKRMKKQVMGGGDIKLLAVTGLHFGALGNVLCLLAACFAGILFGLWARKKAEPFPWGPSIALAAWLCALWGQPIVEAYLGLF